MSDVFANKVVDVTQHLGEGLARCGFCQGSYSVELEIVCSDCASGLCPFCATRSSGDYLCPDCRVAHKRISNR